MTTPKLQDRYGRTPTRRGVLILGGILAVIAVGVIIWIASAQVGQSVDSDDLGYVVVDEHTVSVSFQVTVDPERDVACAIQALDREFGVVGWKIVELPAGTRTRAVTTDVPTVAEATTGLVKSCWVA